MVIIINSSILVTQKAELIYSHEAYTICTDPGYYEYTVDSPGTIMILARCTFWDNPGHVKIWNDNNLVLDWTKNAQNGFPAVNYTEHINAGTHKITGWLDSSANDDLTRALNIFVMFFPD